ncbi:MAG TPA: hypothetical protein VFZ76_01240 [Anaerolineales bacterium]
MKTRAKISLILIIILALVTVGTVAAQEEAPCQPDPETGTVSGTVVGVDEEAGVITIDPDSDPATANQCTVALGDSSGGHPISTLLGQFFGDFSTESLSEALKTLSVCAVEDETTMIWTIEDCAGEEPNAKVISVNEDGSITLMVVGEAEHVTVTDPDEDTAALQSALEALMGEWAIDEDGTLHQTGEEIDRLHEEENLGFGVIVKFLSMAQDAEQACAEQEAETQEAASTEDGDPCAITLQSLVDDFKGGMGIGQMFQQYGKPDKVGIGHVRNDKENKGNGPEQEMNGDETSETTNGPGNKPEVPPGQLKKQDNQTTELQNQGPGNGNPGKGNNGKAKGKP